ncbi:NAD(+) diphosphatase [Micromonospora parathelypteridis]|uniref:NAD(+) diphosphatase n=1 Tax=Micromonospora parathelypteridis TaxID=1839617 RepID=A0A840VM73_9ACTN|nr:NAD(+) diphosphatase [Micromonospora parathelypteridis]MBB5478123.1 NAD+ diphosphatase [Micromonospora parathelypteridis]GGO13497.1 NADH pyrophosphatase [Micromonospora parathelypteridis]
MDTAERVLAYGGGWLDRAGPLRTDPTRLNALRTEPTTVVLPLWQDRCLVDADGPVRLTAERASLVMSAAGETVFLGLDGKDAVFAADLSALAEQSATEMAGAARSVDVRALVGRLEPGDAAVQAYARGLLHWHRQQRFCGTCGAATVADGGGHVRTCTGGECGRLLFPRIEPAIIVLVEAPGPPGRCLLARHAGAPEDAYSTLAGFVEVGESLEDAVRREMAEEAGVTVTDVTYQGSQAWPFPAGLMVGFRAIATSDEVRVDGDELLEARWFTRAELRDRVASGRTLGRVDAIDHRLLEDWLASAS